MNPSLLLIPDRYKAAKLYSQIPDSGAGDLTFARASVATRVNASGLIESVASGVPRLDYTGGGCPSLLLEPQRTNLLLHSNDFSQAAWTKVGATLTSGQSDPFGGTTAWKLELSSGGNNYLLQSAGTGQRAASVYMRADVPTSVGFSFGASTGATYAITTSWQRYTFSDNQIGGGFQIDNYFGISPSGQAKTIYIYQAQLESASYATSPIFTTTASVTRLADSASKTGISSLIGQTQGTIFLEATFPDTQSGQVFMELTGTAPNVNFQLSAGLFFFFSVGEWSISAAVSPNVKYKIAAAYKNNDIVLYINGVQRGTDTSASITAKSNFYINTRSVGDFVTNMRANTAALYPVRFSNSELASLTSL
jgi:hypothetical protein